MLDNGDDLLRKALEYVDVEGNEEIRADMANDDYPMDVQVQIILAKAVLALRPDLKQNRDKDVVYIIKSVINGRDSFSVPSNSLDDILRENPPYDDSAVWTYSISKRKLLKKLYKGTGTIWECCK